MSVPEPRREKSKLEVCVKAHDLCCYTLQITANKKVFTEEYQRSLTDKAEKAVQACEMLKAGQNFKGKSSRIIHGMA